MNYVIKKTTDRSEILYFNYDLDGYDFLPKNSVKNSLKIDEIIIINPSLIDKLLTIKFKNRYKKLVMIVLSILNDSDSTEGDMIIALNEIAKLKEILLYKYRKFLKKEKEKVFLEQLKILENDLNKSLIEIKEYNYTEEKSKGR